MRIYQLNFRTGLVDKYAKANQFQVEKEIAKSKEADKAYKQTTIAVIEAQKQLDELNKKDVTKPIKDLKKELKELTEIIFTKR